MAQRIKREGGLVGDLEVIEALFDVLVQPEYALGTVVDGFPRTQMQVDVLRLLHQKLKAQAHDHNLPRPRFRVVVLFVDEATSISRQLTRGKQAQKHNAKVRHSGVGDLLPVRDTDLSISAARKRYTMYLENTLAPLETMKVGVSPAAPWTLLTTPPFQSLVPFNTIDATGTLDQVEAIVQHEMMCGLEVGASCVLVAPPPHSCHVAQVLELFGAGT